MRWRYWLIEWPAYLTEVGYAWYRFYLMVLLWLAATLPLATVLVAMGLWFGFGIRWGW